jgi:glycerophosphoryl diester phosphodiesterase
MKNRAWPQSRGSSGYRKVDKRTFTTWKSNMQKTKVIAHRGAWKKSGLPQNTISALKKAEELGCDGCELDVHLTADGVVVVNHDHDFYGTSIEEATYTELSSIKHPNGETIPTLEEFLSHASVPLVLEIKASVISVQRSLELTTQTLAAVKKSTFKEALRYISFDEEVLAKVLLEDSAAMVFLLNGKLTPAQLKEKGWHGLAYNTKVLRENPHWIAEAQALDLVTNVWTVNDADNMRWFIDSGIDFIYTDEPELLFKLQK